MTIESEVRAKVDRDPLNGIIREVYGGATTHEKVVEWVDKARQERADMLHVIASLIDAAERRGAGKEVCDELRRAYFERFDHDGQREHEWMEEAKHDNQDSEETSPSG